MSIQPPKIDNRSYEDIVKQTEELVKKYTDWKPHSEGKADAGMALIRIFGHMATLVSDRLNQVPDKNFLAFLDLIGTQLLPPQPAKVPLTFYLAEGSSVDAVVPAHTQVAAPPAEGREDEVVFETDRELVVTTAQLKAVFVREPGKDLYSDRTSRATSKKDAAFEAFAAFEGEQLIEHCLYLACDELFTLPGNKTVTLKFDFTDEQTELTKLPISWSYWDGSWRSLLPTLSNEGTTNEWKVTINKLPVPTRLAINGKEAQWLRASLESTSLDENAKKGQLELKVKHIKAFIANNNTIRIASGSNKQEDCKITTIQGKTLTIQPPLKNDHSEGTSVCFSKFPMINNIIVSAEIRNDNLTPDFCFFNAVPIDISKDFYPFGEQPRFNDTLYIASQEVFAIPNTTVTIDLQLSDGLDDKTNRNVKIAWEFWDGRIWGQIVISQEYNFTRSEKVILTLPIKISQATVNGETSYWIRARIVKGDFGEPAHSTKSINSVNGYPIYELIEATFNPPSIKSLRLSYSYNVSPTVSTCYAYNDFHYEELRTIAETNQQSFQPFKTTADRNPTLYLGFDKHFFANRPITLFAQVELPKPGEALKEQSSDTETVQLVWEYCSPSGWSSLGVQDETKGFAERGLIQFIGPTDLTKSSEFGQELYWLRVRWEAGEFRVPPRLKRILTNTMWATQATTLTNEILGSSDGNPNQIFQTVQKPVLHQGEQLEVQEAKIPSPEKLAVIKSQEGNDAVKEVKDETGQIEAVWLRWHKVRDFYGSGPRDRHYVLDRLTGEVRFGDGQYGMIPPQGRNNIRFSQYQTGGGKRGNVAVNTLTQMKTTIPYVEKMTNLEAAGGGAEQETLEQVKERGPKWLRHRNRAVTWQDFEDIAYEASPEVARAKAIPFTSSFNPLDPTKWLDPKKANQRYAEKSCETDRIRLLILPRSTAPQPIPSLSLIDKVEAYIRDRCDPSINLQVTGPEWQPVSVKAKVVPVSLEKAFVVRTAVIQRLEDFLHPLTGGKEGHGWNLGRSPHKSDLYAVIEEIPGVDYVSSLHLEPISGTQLHPEQLIYSGTHEISSIWRKEEA